MKGANGLLRAKKAVIQCVMLLAGAAMVCVGAMRGEKALCDTIARSLRRLAYSVDCCYDGQSALDMLSIEKFDLVVLDLNLTEKDGLSVLKSADFVGSVRSCRQG